MINLAQLFFSMLVLVTLQLTLYAASWTETYPSKQPVKASTHLPLKISSAPSSIPTKGGAHTPHPSFKPSRKPSKFTTKAPVSLPPSRFPTPIPIQKSGKPSFSPVKIRTSMPTSKPSLSVSTESPSKTPKSFPTYSPSWTPVQTSTPTISQPSINPALPPTSTPASYPAKLQESIPIFRKYQEKYNVTFTTKEAYLQGLQAFTKTLQRIHSLNNEAASGSTKFGINAFSHISANVLDKKIKGFISISSFLKEQLRVHARPDYLLGKSVDPTKNVNWFGIYTTPVKNQWYCGSCWIFSAVSQIESDSIRLMNKSPKTFLLSEQAVLDCIGTDGCNGGDPSQVYSYAVTNGLIPETSAPYTDYQGGCRPYEMYLDSIAINASVFLKNPTEQDLAVYIQNVGPLSVCVATGGWFLYKGGIMTAHTCGTDVDHCVQLVGLNIKQKYWIVSKISDT